MSTILSIATFGAGCFWCVEAVFEQLDGVHAVESGYMGGEVLDPTYREICSGKSGHAEVTQIHYDPKIVSYETLLDWLWRSHDPTTLNRQGADIGTQYRSAIFYHNDDQRKAAEASKVRSTKRLCYYNRHRNHLPRPPTTPQRITTKITIGSIQTRLIAR
jgi:peptide-methionine (S)-S-oxide reductase